jgi:methyltransferase (TIGR00027 family)
MKTIHSVPFFETTWAEDYANRINPELMTKLLHQAVPVLRYSDWKILHVEEGLCQTVLPLNLATTNQHGTHQAALISLSADYTGGMALASLLRGVPLSGIHRCTTDNSVSLWLASMSVKFRAPSSGHMIGTCRIAHDAVRDIQRRYFRGDRVLATLPVEFRSNGDLVANAEMKYFAQPSAQLAPTSENPSRSALFNHKLKASARMIAGVRAQECQNRLIRMESPHDSIAAGPHGEILAARLQTVLPQLTEMVHARTQHCDEALRSVPGLAQVVILGAGLDLRPVRLAEEYPDVRFIELDLPEMIEERQRVISQLPVDTALRRTLVPIDFKSEDLIATLMDQAGYDPALPTVFVYEGCSMYFSEKENKRMFSAVCRLLQHPASRLWVDVVNTAIVKRQSTDPGVSAFLDGMDELGESFVFGLDDPVAYLRELGFDNVSCTTSGEYLQRSAEVFDAYAFVLAGPSSR